MWSALTRAAPLRPCASLRVLPGAKGAGPLRNALGWLCLLFCDQMVRRIVHCLLWKSNVAMLLCLLPFCCSCATLFYLCDRMHERESF